MGVEWQWPCGPIFFRKWVQIHLLHSTLLIYDWLIVFVFDIYLFILSRLVAVLWGVVNNAGVANLGLIDWMPVDEFKQAADVNLWGLIDVTKTFLPLIKKAEGRVVNFSSMLGQKWQISKENSKRISNYCSICTKFLQSWQTERDCCRKSGLCWIWEPLRVKAWHFVWNCKTLVQGKRRPVLVNFATLF